METVAATGATGLRWIRWAVAGAFLVLLAVLGTVQVIGREPAQDVLTRVERDVVVGAGETLDETLFAASQSVRIVGVVEGDVVVAARHVVVTGTIRGSLTVAAADVEIEVDGLVEGGVHCACEELSMRGTVGGNLYAAGDRIAVTKTGAVARDAILLGAAPRVDGTIGRDLWVYAENVEVVGRVERDLRGAISTLHLDGEAQVGRDVMVSVPAADRVEIASGAEVVGTIDIEEKRDLERSKYLSAQYYATQLFQLAGAFIVGLVLIGVWPRLVTAPLGGSNKALSIVGTGFLLLIAFPLVCVFAMLTIVGLPLAAIGMGAYLVALYLAEIVVAGRLGQALLGQTKHRPVTHLLAGLAVLTVASELPVVGGWVTFGVMVSGLGIGYRVFRDRTRS